MSTERPAAPHWVPDIPQAVVRPALHQQPLGQRWLEGGAPQAHDDDNDHEDSDDQSEQTTSTHRTHCRVGHHGHRVDRHRHRSVQ